MKILHLMIVPVFLSVLAIPAISNGERTRTVALITPRAVDDMFFGLVNRYAKMAGNQLGIRVVPYGAEEDHFRLVEIAKELLSSTNKPDAIVFVNFKEMGSRIIMLAETAKVPVFVMNSAILDKTMGRPREKYKYWIGESTPDDVAAGYNLAEYLFSKANRNAEGKISMVALQGPFATGASLDRQKGFEQALEKHKDSVVLRQSVHTDNWDPIAAKSKAAGLIKRYKNISCVWAASDGMALAAVEEFQKSGFVAGKDFIAGGVDWSNQGIEAVRTGKMAASAGGHLLEGAWVMVLLADYFAGIDFAGEGTEVKFDMPLITRDNLPKYDKLFHAEKQGSIDFKRFSRTYNPNVKKYDYSVESILEQIK